MATNFISNQVKVVFIQWLERLILLNSLDPVL